MSQNPTRLNIKMHRGEGTASVEIDSDAEHELELVPLIALTLHSIITRTEISKEELLDMLSDSIDRMENILLI